MFVDVKLVYGRSMLRRMPKRKAVASIGSTPRAVLLHKIPAVAHSVAHFAAKPGPTADTKYPRAASGWSNRSSGKYTEGRGVRRLARVVEHHSTGNAGGLMNRFNKFLAATFLSAAMLVPPIVSAVTLAVYESASSDPAKQI
jgi:hypothetical protein